MWNDIAQGKFDNRPSYVNWEAAEPNDRHYDPFKAPQRCKGEDCVQIKSWNNVISWCDLDCNIQIPYICEKSRGEKIFRWPRNVKQCNSVASDHSNRLI